MARDFGKDVEDRMKDYRLRSGFGAAEEKTVPEEPQPEEEKPDAVPDSEETSGQGKEKKSDGRKRAPKKGTGKAADAEQKRVMSVSVPVDVYVGLRTLAAQNLTNVSSLVCELYHERVKKSQRAK